MAMQVIQDAWNSTDLPQGGVVTVGKFDGAHRGQRVLLERVVQRASELGVASAVITFDPHPTRVLRPREAPPLLTTAAQKETLLAAAGIDALLVLAFTQELAEVPASRFVEELLVRRLAVREVLVGERFRFGKDRGGDLTLLRRLGERHGFAAEGVEEVVWQGEAVSSSRIRAAVAEGEMEAAMAMLGRPYELTGAVMRGDRMGQRLGWPTVNLGPDNELLPRDGVYATRIAFSSLATEFDSVTNIGTRPTVYENYQRVVESHVLDFASDVYGQRVTLSFYRRLRDERIFPTIMDLSAQIGRDVAASREYFATRRRSEGEDG